MKRIEVFVPVILRVYASGKYDLECTDDCTGTEINEITKDAIKAYRLGEFELIE